MSAPLTNLISQFKESPKKLITYTWLTSLILLGITFIVMCIAASYMVEGSLEKVAAFAAAWTVLIFIIISAVGTVTMRRFQSGLSIGIFTGVVFIMSNQMLILFALFVDRIKNGHNGDNDSVERAMAVFSFFLFLSYAAFGTMLVTFQNDIVKEAPSTSMGNEAHAVADEEEATEDLPPENI
mmetsp:Transcript_20038/g.28784  ORF Transcript_20038/g.28784 Transcript_20038/m.28784 type:complete len:182 (-) Transcript_20038:92-637(-)|eukprot:CAMPEP_0185020776 /NCGR_PEP_ID=MMETSP1103-20130426/3421_1 /TAXON_ID=36769 /ORGANISM="Paraphysomonas bandaiensis, Strain Caron Lab Isolate" /LENGTH=181 /DNA_ID=CAMNT_0027551889 /DNA_START=93 /DNA_END=638 /DNA_ORIENTATION=-